MILNGWKQIARYVNSSVRTVQRWQSMGMPVIRPLPGSRGSVVAYSEHLDSWLLARAHVQSASSLAAPMRIRHARDYRDTLAKTEELRREFQQTRRQMETRMSLLSAEVSQLRENLVRMTLAPQSISGGAEHIFRGGDVIPAKQPNVELRSR